MIRILLISILLMPVAALAQQPNRAPRIIKYTLTPAPTTRPALKYRLIPGPADQIHGDAGPFYLTAFGLAQEMNARYERQIDRLMDLPLDQLDAAQVRQATGDGTPLFVRFLEAGSLRDHAEWGTTIRTEGYEALLPYLNNARMTANLLSLRIRERIVEKDPQGATHLLGCGFTLAHHLNGGDPFLVESLVSTGMAIMMCERVDELIQSPNCPNLYWALADLPHPFINSGRVLDNEAAALRYTFPGLLRARDGNLSAQEFRQILQKASAVIGAKSASAQVADVVWMIRVFPAAKRHMIEQGLSPKQVDALPAHQVIAIYMLDQYQTLMDDMGKWARLPWWQAQSQIWLSQKEIEQAKTADAGSPLLRLVPALQTAMQRFMKLDRRIASLQCVEAIRAYAASHEGKLPEKLEDLIDTPAPLDPATGEPFQYQLTGQTAVLDAPLPNTPERGFRYEITIEK